METLYMSSAIPNWPSQQSNNSAGEWTREENKQFESALAIYGDDRPDRWIRVAEMIPGKSVFDVMKQYRELEEDVSDIEAGRVPIPGYLSSSFSFEFVDQRGFNAYRKKSLGGNKGSEHERKKGVPWTEEEHRRFLLGLLKYGKGEWRNISRNFVVSKTPTQVASHAQKYYIRQLSGGKDKRRPSIHDITTVNLSSATLLDHDARPLFDQPNTVMHDWNNPHGGAYMAVGSAQSNPYDIAYGAAAYYRARVKPENSVF
jgi:SHAQKYF class myb-like DNA-binding protein